MTFALTASAQKAARPFKLCAEGLKVRRGGGSRILESARLAISDTDTANGAFEATLELNRPGLELPAILTIELCYEPGPSKETLEGEISSLEPPAPRRFTLRRKVDSGAASAAGTVQLILRASADGLEATKEAKILVPSESAFKKPQGLSIQFRVEGSELVAEIELPCPADGPHLLSGLQLQALSDQGAPLLLEQAEALEVCRDDSPEAFSWWFFASGLLAGALLVVLALLPLHRLGWWPWSRALTARMFEEDENASRIKEALHLLRSFESKIDALYRPLNALDESVQDLLSRLSSPFVADDQARLDATGSAATIELVSAPSSAEQALLSVANLWWSGGAPDRQALDRLLADTTYDLQIVTLADLEQTYWQPTGQTYRFRPSTGPAEWLASREASGHLLIVPLDVRLFSAGNSIEIVNNLFRGIEPIPPKFRFRRVTRACRLELVAGEEGTYRARERGDLELDPPSGRALAPEARAVPTHATQALSPRPALDLVSRSQLRGMLDEITSSLREEVRSLSSQLIALEKQIRSHTPPVAESSEIRVEIGGLRDELATISAVPAQMARLEALLEARAGATPVAGKNSESGTAAPEQGNMLLAWNRDGGFEADFPLYRPELETNRRSAPRFDAQAGKAPVVPPGGSDPRELLAQLTAGLPQLLAPRTPGFQSRSQKASEQYLETLVALRADLGAHCTPAGWQVSVRHLVPGGESAQSRSVHVEEVVVSTDLTAVRTPSGILEGSYLYQCGLLLSKPGGLLAAFVLAAGAVPSRYRNGYAPLLEAPTLESSGRVVRVVAPAILRLLDPHNQLYAVELPLKVELEPALGS